jgi:hypothetical protein
MQALQRCNLYPPPSKTPPTSKLYQHNQWANAPNVSNHECLRSKGGLKLPSTPKILQKSQNFKSQPQLSLQYRCYRVTLAVPGGYRSSTRKPVLASLSTILSFCRRHTPATHRTCLTPGTRHQTNKGYAASGPVAHYQPQLLHAALGARGCLYCHRGPASVPTQDGPRNAHAPRTPRCGPALSCKGSARRTAHVHRGLNEQHCKPTIQAKPQHKQRTHLPTMQSPRYVSTASMGWGVFVAALVRNNSMPSSRARACQAISEGGGGRVCASGATRVITANQPCACG